MYVCAMGRAPCCDKNGLKKGPWATEEDQKLIDYIRNNGSGNWRTLPKKAGLQRCGKSCRLRWTNYLRPDIKRGRFSTQEEDTIIQLHSVLGNKWSAIAARLPGRTDNEIKNYWNTHIRKRLLQMGIDPVTHRPRLDLLHLSSIMAFCPNPNPQLLRFAASLLPSQSSLVQNFIVQNVDMDHHRTQIPNQVPPSLVLPHQTQVQDSTIQTTPWDQLMQNDDFNIDGFHDSPQVLFGSEKSSHAKEQWQQGDEWMLSALPEVYASLPNYDYYGSGQSPTDPNPSSTFQSILSSISTPSSSPIPLQSNSTFYSSSTSSSTEDERERSYSSNLINLDFHIPEIMDAVNNIM